VQAGDLREALGSRTWNVDSAFEVAAKPHTAFGRPATHPCAEIDPFGVASDECFREQYQARALLSGPGNEVLRFAQRILQIERKRTSLHYRDSYRIHG
jgi:hypothetical protein